MKLFDIFKKKKEVKEESVEEETRIENGKIYDLNITPDRAKELEKKGFIKIIGE